MFNIHNKSLFLTSNTAIYLHHYLTYMPAILLYQSQCSNHTLIPLPLPPQKNSNKQTNKLVVYQIYTVPIIM